MRFLIKEISPSRKEIRISLNTINFLDTPHYIFGQVDGTFDEGSLDNRYIPTTLANFTSTGPNPAIIRLVVAYLKDNFGTPLDFNDSVLITQDNNHISIVNAVIDDINLINLNSETLPSLVLKLSNELPLNVNELDEISIENQIITTQEEEVYFIPASIIPPNMRGLDYDINMKDDVGNSDIQKLEYESYNDLTSSFNHTDNSVISSILSGSDVNLKINHNKFENHVHFGSAVSKLENFKNKIGKIENYLVEISQSLIATGSNTINTLRNNLFGKIEDEKNTFTPYEKEIYYNFNQIGLAKNYIKNNNAVKSSTKLLNVQGFSLIENVSGSNTGSGEIELFKDGYNVEDKPFYNYSGSLYLSFLMKGDETINGNIKWENYQEKYIPKLPFDTLFSSSLLQPTIKSESWGRYIYHASMSYFVPIESIPIIGSAGSITDFTQGSSEINILNDLSKTGSYSITAGGRYSNLATTVTSSGIPFSGSISPAGELFRIYIDTNSNSSITSSNLTDIKITKNNPLDVLPFSQVHRTGSQIFTDWYDGQYISASQFDDANIHSFINTMPEFLQNDNQMDNKTFRKFVNLSGEHFDLIKNYIDNYTKLLQKNNTEPENNFNNLLPILASQQNWNFNLPFGNKEDASLSEFFGSTVTNINNTSDVKNNIWGNVLTNINYIYRTKGTQNSIRALLNSYGFPPDILKLREHGASLDDYDNSVLSDDATNLLDGLGNTSGNISFTTKTEKLVSYIVDSTDRKINAEWGRNGVNANAVEFIFKPVKGLNTQTLLKSSGSFSSSLWDVVLEPSQSTNVKSRLSFRLNTLRTGSGDIDIHLINNISMSTDYFELKNQRFWNFLLQRTSGPTGSANTSELLITHSYQLAIGEQVNDKIKTLQIISMSLGGTQYSESAANFIGTGSSNATPSSNLIIGETYTGSIAEIRTWKQALSASKFKQHIFDKKSVVGNSITGSRDELIYHYKLNENHLSGSTLPQIIDSNGNNLKDYSLNISASALGHSPLYDTDEFDRVQFNVKIGGSLELSDNNIIIDNERRFINNLNPTEPSVMNVYNPLINKRKASSVIEITRSPQDVINDFTLNQLGNFDFNDKYADPRDINKPVYKDLEKFAKDFFDYYDISLDINKYIRAQAAIFNKDLIKSLKRLVPARSSFSKIGIEIKPTFLERQKIQSRKIEHEFIDIGPNNIKLNGDNTNLVDWEKNIYAGWKIDNLKPVNLTKNISLPVSSYTGSVPSIFENLILDKNANIPISSHTGSLTTLATEFIQNKNSFITISSHSGSVTHLSENLILDKNANIPISSHTGSLPLMSTEFIENKNSSVIISSHTGSITGLSENLILDKNANIAISSHTGSLTLLATEFIQNKNINIPISSHTGSNPFLSSKVKNNTYTINFINSVGNVNKTGSIYLDSDVKNLQNFDIVVASSTSSKPDIKFDLFLPKTAIFNAVGNETLLDKLTKSFDDLSSKWGVGVNDLHFVNYITGSEGKLGDFNTYHYENKYIFNMVGDVESVSGSRPSTVGSFETDFTGTVTGGVYTASKDFSNQTFVKNNIGLGTRPLGITIEFKPASSINFNGGKFLDETFVYPANHQFLVGTSKDSINTLIYEGTQNSGGILLESDAAFTDLHSDAFYSFKNTNAGSNYTIQYEVTS